MLQGFQSRLRSPLLLPSSSFSVPPVPFGTGCSCSRCCLVITTMWCLCTAGICSAVLGAGCKPATLGEAKCTQGHGLAEPWEEKRRWHPRGQGAIAVQGAQCEQAGLVARHPKLLHLQ